MGALPTIAAGLTSVVLGVGVWQVARRLRELETSRRPTEPEAPPGGGRPSGGRPILSALYQEPAQSPMRELSTLAGGPWLLGALALAAITLATSMVSDRPAGAPTPTPPDSAVLLLRHRVDSLSAGLVALRESLGDVALTAKPPVNNDPSPTRIARRPTTPPAAVLPAAPPPPVGSAP